MYLRKKASSEQGKSSVYKGRNCSLFSTELMYRKHVQTVPTKIGIWLQELAQHFPKSACQEYQQALLTLPINTPEDHSSRESGHHCSCRAQNLASQRIKGSRKVKDYFPHREGILLLLSQSNPVNPENKSCANCIIKKAKYLRLFSIHIIISSSYWECHYDREKNYTLRCMLSQLPRQSTYSLGSSHWPSQDVINNILL